MVKVSIVQSAVNGNLGRSYVARPRDFPRRGPSHRCGNYENVIYILLAYFSDCTLLYNQRASVYHVKCVTFIYFLLDNVFPGACCVSRFHLRSGEGIEEHLSGLMSGVMDLSIAFMGLKLAIDLIMRTTGEGFSLQKNFQSCTQHRNKE